MIHTVIQNFMAQLGDLTNEEDDGLYEFLWNFLHNLKSRRFND